MLFLFKMYGGYYEMGLGEQGIGKGKHLKIYVNCFSKYFTQKIFKKIPVKG